MSSFHRRHRYLAHREDTHRWLVSYADYMTLMFAFFVMLYAIAVVNKDRYPVLMDTIHQAVDKLAHKSDVHRQGILRSPKSNSVIETQGESVIQQTLIPKSNYGQRMPSSSVPDKGIQQPSLSELGNKYPGRSLKTIHQQLAQALEKALSGKQVTIAQGKDWLTITFDSQLLFASGSATLLNPAKKLIDRLGVTLGSFNNYIRVRGYTDNEPIHSELFSSNWELSVMRATHVLHYMIEKGIAPERLAVEGYGQYSPVVPNDTKAHRRNNRRVVIALSRYAWQPPVKQSSTDNVEKVKKPQEKTSKGDSKTILTVPLPGGGVRYTTRQD
ncbi:MAG: Outer membrane protein A [Candidatus Celerinatantimonas neptuna]|nr:MAG: Outer membrane protein A [Candidatus Celerinatantimonas neptuna]